MAKNIWEIVTYGMIDGVDNAFVIKKEDGTVLFTVDSLGGLSIDGALSPDGGVVIAPSTFDLALKTTSDNRQVELNSRAYTQATGDSIAFQAVPNQTVTTTGEVFGGQVKPRVADGISAQAVTSLGLDSELKGSGATTVTGDLRNLNTYLGAAAAAHVIGGDAVVIRSRQEISTDPTGDIVFTKILNHEGTEAWDGLIKFVSSADGNTSVGNHDLLSASGTGAFYAGIPCVVKGVGVKYIALVEAA